MDGYALLERGRWKFHIFLVSRYGRTKDRFLRIDDDALRFGWHGKPELSVGVADGNSPEKPVVCINRHGHDELVRDSGRLDSACDDESVSVGFDLVVER